MARMVHSSVRAALIYQHVSQSRDKEIADAISHNVQEARRIGHVRGTPEEMTGDTTDPGPGSTPADLGRSPLITPWA
jgi:hypothetical protein